MTVTGIFLRQSSAIRCPLGALTQAGRLSQIRVAIGLLLCWQAAQAQLVSDGGTRLINGVTTNLLSNLIVGTNSPNTTLSITNAGAVSNASAIVGLNFSSSNNLVRVTGAGSRWNNSSDLLIGSNGVANRLIITNGGLVMNGIGYLGYNLPGSNNLAIVTGSGSFWSNRLSLVIGNFGRTARLVITNGGKVENNIGSIGLNFFGRDSEVIVTGSNSSWTNRGNLSVGNYGAGARLTIANGGRVVANGLGVIGTQVESSNNVARLDGLGSMWLNTTNLIVGSNGPVNQLVISNGALLTCSEGYLGFGLSSGGNEAIVTGASSFWSNRLDLHIGYGAVSNRLLLMNGARVECEDGHVGYDSSNNLAVVSGAGSFWSNRVSLYVGRYKSGNLLVVSNGGMINSAFGNVGGDSGRSNQVVVSGAGSLWTNRNLLFVGSFEAENRLVVTNGGRVASAFGSIGGGQSASNNHAIVTGPASLWSNSGNFAIGQFGSGNRLTITNGGMVINNFGDLGQRVGSSNNIASVAGANSTWLNAAQLTVGSNGWGNRLIISEGGFVANASAYLGFELSSSNNEVLVTGPGSFWSNGSHLGLGLFGSANRLVISNSGVVESSSGTLGNFSASRSNAVIVTGVGSMWSNSFNLRVGNFGPSAAGNRLLITNAGRVVNDDAFIGFGNSDNTVFVTGTGSVWSNRGGLFIGLSGTGNQLVITNGGLVTSAHAAFGDFIDGTNNLVVVSGPNSAWLNAGNLYLGSNGWGNRLIITNGGLVKAGGRVALGLNSSSTNNLLSVNGSTLIVTNSGATGLLEVVRGNVTFSSGAITVDTLQLGSSSGTFTFHAGTLSLRHGLVKNSLPFVVGDGVSPATLNFVGDGTYSVNALTIASNATLTGNAIIGALGLTVQSGGTVSPGSPIGTMILSNAPVLQGRTLMEIGKAGPVLLNDQIQVGATLPYGGTLQVEKLGLEPLAGGDSFQLFSAPGYSGSFSAITLPPLPPGLIWINRLAIDGSVQVVELSLRFNTIALSGTNLLISGVGGPTNGTYYVMSSTNLDLPLISWSRIATNVFDGSGNFIFTNAIQPNVPQRFFRLCLL